MAKSNLNATSLFDSMKKLEPVKESPKVIIQEQAEKIEKKVDVEKKESLKKEEKPEASERFYPSSKVSERKKEESKPSILSMIEKKEAREKKDVHKNFAISKRLDEKFKALAKEYNMSENEFFCQIIEKVL